MKDHILTIVLVSVMAILSLPADAQWSETKPGKPLLTSISPSDYQVGMLPDDEATTSDADFHSSPVMFVENAGQWDDDARFQVWGGPAGMMWLAEDAIWISVLEPGETSKQGDKESDPRVLRSFEDRDNPAPSSGVAIRLSFVGASMHPRIETFDRLDTTVSYFYGNDPDQWRPDVPVWGGVRYVDLYPGIDQELTGEDGQLALRLAVRAGADKSAVRLRVEGADAVELDEDSLRLNTSAGVISWPLLSAPGSYAKASIQTHGEQGVEIDAPFAVAASPSRATKVAFDDSDDMLYGTFLGGSYGERGVAIAIDETGNVFATGDTSSTDFPTTPGAFNSTGGHNDTFVAKLNPTGSALIYATFLDSSSSSKTIVIDETGNAYVTGSTGSENFPVTPGAFDTTHGGGVCGAPYHPTVCGDAFVTKLNATGSSLLYSTFLGNEIEDSGVDIAVDEQGNAYVINNNFTNDLDITPDTYDICPADSFIGRLNADGSALTYCTSFIGFPLTMALDGSGIVYIAGLTYFDDIPVTPGAFDTSYSGGSDGEYGGSIAVDGSGRAFVSGSTFSIDFPTTPNAFDTSFNNVNIPYLSDVFLAGFNQTGSALIYGTFLGGNDLDYSYFNHGLALSETGSAYVIGSTYSDDFPTTAGAFDTERNSEDAFVVKLAWANRRYLPMMLVD